MYQKFRNPFHYKIIQEETNFYRELLRQVHAKNDLIFDVGANQGDKSDIFSKFTKKVIAFEPSEKLYTFLRKRFNNRNIQLFNCALGSNESLQDFYEVEGDESHNSLSKKHIETTVTAREIATLQTVKHKKVKVERLEHFIATFGMPVYIKIDVEGFEHEVIKGLKTPVPLISFEANLPDFYEETIQIIEYLEKISSGKYRFNFTANSSFLQEKFLPKEEAIGFLSASPYSCLDIYAML